MNAKIEEAQVAELIVGVLPTGVARACSSDRESLRYTVRGEGMKLHTIVLRRASLRKLAQDPQREVKIEYLRRDLLHAAKRRAEFSYPRQTFAKSITVKLKRGFAFGIPIASVL
jgi:hypothetical protein